jgi:hypothetical protein
MALKKSKELNTGVTAEYWVAETRTDAINKKTRVTMLGFLSKEARDEGHSPLTKMGGTIIDKTYPTGEEVYAAIKAPIEVPDGLELEGATNFFEDAEDI